jgi:hypothetical protein
MKNLLSIALFIALSANAPAQMLRRAIAAADLVLVATSVRVIPAKTHTIHRLKIGGVLRGPVGFDASKQISVVVTKRVAAHTRPTPARQMIYCLHDYTNSARASKLPDTFAPYYKMSGYAGSAVVLDKEADKDSRLAFARVLVASQKGQASRKTAEALFTMALMGERRIRTEAASSIAERPALLSCLTELHLNKLLARAAGETEDIRYKIELASICAVRKTSSLIPTLCLSVEHVGDEAFLRALGRFANYIHGEAAAKILSDHAARARGKTRDRLIVALGATSTEGALETLLELRKHGRNKVAVEAALRIHGSPRAAAAIANKRVISGKNDEQKADEKGRKTPR